VLEPIDLHERFGPNTDVDTVYEQVTGLMQECSTRWPLNAAGL
jgi:hypothetical protein